MKRRVVSLALAVALLLAMLPGYAQSVNAATQSAYSPYAMIEYGYSSSVTAGTIRYVSQVVSDSYFYSSYWPSGTFGNYIGAQVECGTASISMALSYIGINKTPDDILTPYNGSTMFALGWGGSTYMSVSASALSTAVDRYINGNGKYSPPVIHIPGYSTAGHYVVVAGRISSNQYQILDPWQRTVTTMTVNGSSATYSKYGYTTYDTIDQIHQWYNENASLDYASSCESYPAHCLVTVTEKTNINTQPCSAGSYESTTIEAATIGGTYTATKLYKNSFGNLWYEVLLENGQTGHLYGGATQYVKQLTSDISLTGASYPNGHVAGKSFVVNGTVKSSYNQLATVAAYVHSGFGTSGTKVTGSSATVNGKSYTLASSTVDAATAFGGLSTGKYTYAIYATYENYYAADTTTLGSNTGTLTLLDEYFVVVPSGADQSSCSHSNSTTVIAAATCTNSGISVTSCSKCGKITENVDAPKAHAYGSWITVNATCAENGYQTRTCSACGDVEMQTINATGHKYSLKIQPATCETYAIYEYTCGVCGHNYKLNAGDMTSQWLEAVPGGMSSIQFNTKTQYRYADCLSASWEQTGNNTIQYVTSWPSGFDTSSSFYTQYNKKSSKVTASETAAEKTVINSDGKVGYLYYHWCSPNHTSCYGYKTSTHTIFHAYYDTTDPSNYECDTSDYSYKTSHSTCSNSQWWLPIEVYAQDYTTYRNVNDGKQWSDWSAWSDTVYTPIENTRKVETRTVYQLKEAKLGDHSYVNGTCTVCGHRETVVENSPDIKWQVTRGTNANSASTNLRFLTWVDSLENYSSVTFNVTINGKTTKLKSTTAYTAILASGVAIRNPSNIFKNEDANYFVTFTLSNVPKASFDTPIVVTVTWTDLWGNETTSESKTIVISSDWA